MTKKSRVILVANSTWNIYNFRLNIVNKLLENNIEVKVLAPIDEYLEYKEKYPQVQHIALRTLKRDSTNPFRDLLLTIELIRKYKWLKPDLVLHFTNKPNIYGGFACKYTGSKSIAVVTGLGYTFIHSGFLNKIVRFLYKLSGKTHCKFIFENKDDKALFIKENIVTKENAHAVKGCGVNTDYYNVLPNGQIKNDITFTFIGRLLYDKGINEFIEAAKIVKQKNKHAKFIVIGEFDESNPATIDKETLAKWVDEGIIDYKGFVKDIRPLIGTSDCIVLPSYREGMPRTLLEGMSMAKPIITTDVPGCRETIIENKNGFIVQAKDHFALAKSFDTMAQLSYEERKKMGQQGRRFCETIFDDKLIAQEIFDIIKKEINV